MKTPAPQEFSPSPRGTDEVLYAAAGGTAYVRLNRPKALNSLTRVMVEDLLIQLDEWVTDDRVTAIVLDGAGDRALCAGGDVKAVRAAIVNGDPDAAVDFWAREYDLALRLGTYPKPVTAHLRGVVMGGGLGLSAHVTHRPIGPDARVAMPETAIGFFPDVGITRIFARTPGELGTYAAVTGATFGAADAVLLGLADPSSDLGPAPILMQQNWIDECFAGDDPAAIIGRLESHPASEARECAAEVRRRSPLAVSAALARVRRAATEADLAETLAVDTRLARGMMLAGDFAEGVRAKLVDKDDRPRWRHARIEDVTPADVDALFSA